MIRIKETITAMQVIPADTFILRERAKLFIPVMLFTGQQKSGLNNANKERFNVGLCAQCHQVISHEHAVSCSNCACRYCNTACQELHLPNHELVCAISKEILLSHPNFPNFSAEGRGPFFLLIVVIYWKIHRNQNWFPKDTQKFHPIIERDFKKSFDYFWNHFGSEFSLSKSEVESLARGCFRKIRLLHSYLTEYVMAFAYFENFSLMEHSCNPNCFFFYSGNQIHVRTIRDIQPNEKLTVSYDFNIVFSPTMIRRTMLRYHHFFPDKCECFRCNSLEALEEDLVLSIPMNRVPNKFLKSLENNMQGFAASCDIDGMKRMHFQMKELFPYGHHMHYELYKILNIFLLENIESETCMEFNQEFLKSFKIWKQFNLPAVRVLFEWFQIFQFFCYGLYLEQKLEKLEKSQDYIKFIQNYLVPSSLVAQHIVKTRLHENILDFEFDVMKHMIPFYQLMKEMYTVYNKN